MAKLQIFLAALCATSAFASPRARNQRRAGGWGDDNGSHKDKNNGWGSGKKNTGGPAAYGSTSEDSQWIYGSTTACVATTVYETEKASTVTLPASTVHVTGQ